MGRKEEGQEDEGRGAAPHEEKEEEEETVVVVVVVVDTRTLGPVEQKRKDMVVSHTLVVSPPRSLT